MMILIYLRSSLLDNYKDRNPGLHTRTLPLLVPTSHSLVYHQNFRRYWFQQHIFPVASLPPSSPCSLPPIYSAHYKITAPQHTPPGSGGAKQLKPSAGSSTLPTPSWSRPLTGAVYSLSSAVKIRPSSRQLLHAVVIIIICSLRNGRQRWKGLLIEARGSAPKAIWWVRLETKINIIVIIMLT